MIYLYEDIESVKRQPEFSGIDDDTFMVLINLDPTYKKGSNSLGTYGKWILSHFKKGDIKYTDFDDVILALTLFDKYRKVLPNKDIGKYKTVADIMDVIRDMDDDSFYDLMTPSQKVKYKKKIKSGKITVAAEDDYDIAYQDDYWTVYTPNTHEASMKLGADTDWCTAHEDPYHYNCYTEDGSKLYIFINNKGYKYQFSDQTGEFRDAFDNDADVDDLADDASDEFVAFLKGLDPNLFTFTRLVNGLKIKDSVVVGYDEDELLEIYGEDSNATLIIPDGVTAIGYNAFEDLHGFYDVTIPESVRIIWNWAFCNSGFNEIYVPDSVLKIGCGAFSECRNLTKVHLPYNQYYNDIENSLFCKCYIPKITIPPYVTSIGYKAFSDCRALRKIVIQCHKKVTGLGNYAFSGCNNLTVYTDDERLTQTIISQYHGDINNLKVFPLSAEY